MSEMFLENQELNVSTPALAGFDTPSCPGTPLPREPLEPSYTFHPEYTQAYGGMMSAEQWDWKTDVPEFVPGQLVTHHLAAEQQQMVPPVGGYAQGTWALPTGGTTRSEVPVSDTVGANLVESLQVSQMRANFEWQLRVKTDQLNEMHSRMCQYEAETSQARAGWEVEQRALKRQVAAYRGVLERYCIPLEEAIVDWADEADGVGDEEAVQEDNMVVGCSVATTLKAMFPHATIRTKPDDVEDGRTPRSAPEDFGILQDLRNLEQTVKGTVDERAMCALQALPLEGAQEALTKVNEVVNKQEGQCRNLSSIMQSVCRKIEKQIEKRHLRQEKESHIEIENEQLHEGKADQERFKKRDKAGRSLIASTDVEWRGSQRRCDAKPGGGRGERSGVGGRIDKAFAGIQPTDEGHRGQRDKSICEKPEGQKGFGDKGRTNNCGGDKDRYDQKHPDQNALALDHSSRSGAGTPTNAKARLERSSSSATPASTGSKGSRGSWADMLSETEDDDPTEPWVPARRRRGRKAATGGESGQQGRKVRVSANGVALR
eukprot:TRINITY_DN25210_c0_g1_i1.p1 TRINITY_DN25210_c0_g1~~TRINITY_DN25210_c0_g1_i1.p1  ORF type:complete len:585 (-),score=109.31 TRINITY_DN25210_c0_g1_i1:123-1757(-)